MNRNPLIFDNKTIVITGGTGSLGKILARRILDGKKGLPKKLIIFSRDEAKQHEMRLEYQHKNSATDEVIYSNFKRVLEFRIGDVRDYVSVCSVLKYADIVINAAAIKQVPTCEYFPYEAVKTNIDGAQNIVRAISEHNLSVETVVGVSTDKACKPVNVMGMSKAIQERVFITANIDNTQTRFICVRYGNVVASRGSVIPLFLEQIKKGGPLTITTKEMTRFFLYLEKAVDTIFTAMVHAKRGETYIPKVPSVKIINVARALTDEKPIKIVYTGIRPGEKIHEVLISDEEVGRSFDRGKYYVIKPLLPELQDGSKEKIALSKEYSSLDNPLSLLQTKKLLQSIITQKGILKELELLL